MRADEIFADLSRESDKNRATLSNKGHEMARSAVSNKNVTPTAALNNIAKIGTKVSVSTLLRDSQRPVDAPLPTRGTSPLLLEETEAKMADVFLVM